MQKAIKNMIIILSVIVVCLVILLVVNSKKQNTSNSGIVDEPVIPNTKYNGTKQKYECNEFEILNVATGDLLSTYFNKYKDDIFTNLEKAYNTLDEEYRQKKFGSIDNYKIYLQARYEEIGLSIIDSYKISHKDDEYTQYLCIDNNGNYYIFKETAIMDYSIMLDTYTIDLPEFLEKYNNGSEQQKVALNIEKFVQAINDKSYNYAYNCLADSFKNNYFRTQEEFETYVKSNFYESNSIKYNSFEEQGELYTYSVTITNTETNEQKTKTFIMQLGEGTEFALSFDR
mgnify:CR=1 FL=1